MSTDETVREVPTEDLAEAEQYLREICDVSPGFTDGRLARVMAEYDRRGRERDSARAEVQRLHTWDETTTAIAALWGRIDHKLGGTRDQLSELARLLDALARAHEDGGQDR